MTQHTGRDIVWDVAIRTAMIEDSFSIDEVVEDESIAVSKRTVRDTMKTMAELGWLEEQTVNTNQWQQGPLMTEDMDSTSKKQHQGPTPIDQVDQTRELEGGEVYVGTVDKASSNALIWLDEPHGSHINLAVVSNLGAIFQSHELSFECCRVDTIGSEIGGKDVLRGF